MASAIVNPKASGAELCRHMKVLESLTKAFESKDKRLVQRAVSVVRNHVVKMQAVAAPQKDCYGAYARFAGTN